MFRRITLVIALALAGCAMEAPPRGPDSAPPRGGKFDGAQASAVVITADDNGATVEVPLGTDIAVRLPSNPSAGFSWEVTQTNRTFGYPTETSFESDDPDAIGSGGYDVLVWPTTAPFFHVGDGHTVRLGYARAGQEPIEEFVFSVTFVEPGAPAHAPVMIDDDDDGATVDVVLGRDVEVRLASNPSTGYQWEIDATDRSFGYPDTEEFEIEPNGPIGSGGTQVLTWRTDRAFLSAGSQHRVHLVLRRGDDIVDDFEFVVNLVEEDAPPPAPRAASIGYEDNGASVDVAYGSHVEVRLPANPSTGYAWSVTSTNRTFGYPIDAHVEVDENGPIGSGGEAVFTWATDGFGIDVGDAHSVTLSYARGAEPAVDIFSFTVHIVDADGAD